MTPRTSPHYRIRCGLQALARALDRADAWTPDARTGYHTAAQALDDLPVVTAATPTGPTTFTTRNFKGVQL